MAAFLLHNAMPAQYMSSSCVCLSQAGTVPKWLNAGSRKDHLAITQGVLFSDAKDLSEILTGSPPMGAPSSGGVGWNRRLLTNILLYLNKELSYSRGTVRRTMSVETSSRDRDHTHYGLVVIPRLKLAIFYQYKIWRPSLLPFRRYDCGRRN